MGSRLLLVALGGALGAVCRYLLAIWIKDWTDPSAFPWGTLTVNVLGSFALGLLLGLDPESSRFADPQLRLALGVGFLGAFTTFSTFSVETITALEQGQTSVALGNVVANLVMCLGAAWVGLRLAG